MNTPILTKMQQKHSLSGKKGPVKGLRNILAQPFENYWPTVNIDQYPTLVTIMHELLPLIRRPTFKIPGHMLRHMSKEKRTLAKKETLEKKTVKPDENILKLVILGVNAVTRALEKNNVCCVLLDATVEPSLLIKHIVVMAQNKKVPILLLPVLKTVTLQKIGFSTAAFALKHDVMQSLENVFHPLYKLVAEVSKDFQSPKCPVQLFKSDETPDKRETSEKNANCDPTLNNSKPEKPVIVFTDVYKYRSSRKERAFIPPTINESSQVSQVPSDEFIALSEDLANNEDCINAVKKERYINIHKEEEEERNKSEINPTKKDDMKSFNKSKLINNKSRKSKKRKNNDNDVTYLSLKIKRIQGNSNRTKATKFAKKKKE